MKEVGKIESFVSVTRWSRLIGIAVASCSLMISVGTAAKPENTRDQSLVGGKSKSKNQVVEPHFARALKGVNNGETVGLKAYMEREVTGERRNRHRAELLLAAVVANNLEALKFLIEQGVDANANDNRQSPALMEAISNAQSEAAMLLLKAGANPQARSSRQKKTPLMLAAETAQMELLAELLRLAPTTLDQIDANGETALFLALRLEQDEVMKWLISRGASLQSRNRKGQSLKDLAQEIRLPKQSPIWKILKN